MSLQYYYKNKERINEEKRKERLEVTKYWVDKLGSHCKYCGVEVKVDVPNSSDNKAEFHHPYPELKTVEISECLNNLWYDRIPEEIEKAKIQLVCHKCHVKISGKQKSVPTKTMEFVKDEYLSGKYDSIRQMSFAIHIPQTTIVAILKRMGVRKQESRSVELKKDDVLKLWNEGKNTVEISKEIGISRQSVVNILHSFGISDTDSTAKKSKDVINEIIRLKSKGYTQRAIAKELGIGVGTVCHYLIENNKYINEQNKEN